jgi:hypothetical protein
MCSLSRTDFRWGREKPGMEDGQSLARTSTSLEVSGHNKNFVREILFYLRCLLPSNGLRNSISHSGVRLSLASWGIQILFPRILKLGLRDCGST